MVSAGSIAISRSRPSTLAAILTLRPNGEVAERAQDHHGDEYRLVAGDRAWSRERRRHAWQIGQPLAKPACADVSR